MASDRNILARAPEPDPHPDLTLDRGVHGQGVGRWVAEDKHRLLTTYIDAARAAAKKGFAQWVYIDPFCGPGRMQVQGESNTRPGGAVVAWRQSLASGTPFGKLLVGDISSEKVEACAARLRASGAPVQSFIGPAEETVVQMVRAVPRNSLCLAYIDPYNLALLSHPMLAALAELRQVDFVVHFSTMDLYRNVDMELDPERARFDNVSPGWRQRVEPSNKSNLADRMFADWSKQIQSLGFEFSEAMPLIKNTRGDEIYKLAFFASHDLPRRLWKDVARGENHSLF
ncbi:MAG: three-Cys-motif partner protein TcmP [Alcaligenaceae bacterium]|nr:MAG: three-Cys-motif partner protein TcmP [Alcaligenaceae bacterium]